MARKYKSYTADFKLKVALEASRNEKTLNQIASEYSVSKSLVSDWRNQLLKSASSIFEGHKQKVINKLENTEFLQQQVGKLTVELEWLKKNSGII